MKKMRKFHFMIDINLKRSFTFLASTNYTPAIYLSLIKVYGSCIHVMLFVVLQTLTSSLFICIVFTLAMHIKISYINWQFILMSIILSPHRTKQHYVSVGMLKGEKVVYDQHKNKCWQNSYFLPNSHLLYGGTYGIHTFQFKI